MTKNKLIRTLVVVMMLLCTVAILFACSDADVDYSDGDGDKNPSTGGIVITFMDDGEEVHTTTDPQEALSYTPEEKEGYVFKGWFLDAEFNDEFTKLPTKSVTVYAKWEVQTFKVTFKHNDGSTIQVNGEDYQIVVYGQSAVAPEDPTLEGFDFKGWDEDFSSVKSDLTIRAMFDTKKQDIVVFDDNGVEIKRVTAAIGSDITALYQTLYDDVENAIPGGLVLEALCVDPELTETYKAPASGHTMPYTDLLLYTRVSLQDIEGLKITADRDNFRYDTKGFTLTSSLYANSVITYSYEWYDAQASAVIAGENSTTLQVGCKDVGEYTYEVRVTASYKNLEKKYDSEVITITVTPGTLEGMISVKGFNDVYNGKIRELDFEGTLLGDTITYRRVGETEYVPSFIKDAGDYNLETKIERANYEPYEITGLDAVEVSIAKKDLTLNLSLPISRVQGDVYFIFYGSVQPYIEHTLQGFVDGENETFLTGKKVQDNPYNVGSPIGRYVLGLQKDCWTSVNYNIVSWPTLKLQVIQRELTINVDSKAVIYGENVPVYTASLEGAIEEDIDKIKAGIDYTCEYQVGTGVKYDASNNIVGYDIVASYENNDYAITINNSSLVVSPKAVTVTPNSFNIVYGDNQPKYTFKAEGLVNNETIAVLGTPVAVCQYTANATNKVYSSVGSYAISINDDRLDNPNYNITCGTGFVRVSPKHITMSMADTGITYYDSYPSADTFASNLYAEGLVGADTISGSLKTDAQSFTSNYAIGQPVGTYAVTVGGYYSQNYIINNNSAVVGNLVVGKKALTISVVGSTITYGDNLDVQVKYTGLVGDDEWAPENAVSGGSIVGGYEAGYDEGEYQVEIGNYTATNYEISYESGTIKVVPRALTIKARGYTEDPVIWNGTFGSTAKESLLEVVGLFAGDTIQGVLQSTSDVEGIYVAFGSSLDNKFAWDTENPFAITRDGADRSSNYVVSYDFQVAINTVGVFVTANTVIYDGKAHGLDVDYLEGFENLDLVKVEFSADGLTYSEELVTETIVGAYEIFYKITRGDEVKVQEKLTLTINPRPITIAVDEKTITYGDADPELTYTTIAYEENQSPFADGEDISSLGTLNIVAQNYEGNAGHYDIVASGLDNDNYTITIVNSTLIVERKDLTLTADSYTITFGDAEPNYQAEAVGFVNGESIESLGTQVLFNCAFTADINGKAGEFAIVPVLSLANYKITAVEGKLTVNKKNITLTADNKSATFGDVTPDLTATATGLAYKDTVDTMGSYTLTTEYTRGNAVGRYAINLTAESEKYNITVVAGKITVSAKSVSVSWTNNTLKYTYDGTDRSSAITAKYYDIYDNPQNAVVTFKSLNASSKTPNRFENAATYKVTATTSDSNYILTNASLEMVMNKATYKAEDVKYENSFSGVYSPEKTLSKDYPLNKAGFYWKNGDLIPSVDVEVYDVYYNLDPENYFDFNLKVNVIITPALISLDANNEIVNTTIDVERQIDINSTDMNPTYNFIPTIWWIDGQKEIGAGGNYTLTYSNGTSFKPGTHLTTMTFTSTNFKLNTADGSQVVSFFIKYKSVLVGSTLYTPEDALNTATSGTAIVKANTSFATQPEVISRYYNGSSYYTVKSGVTLLLPYKANDTIGYIDFKGGDNVESGSDEYKAHPTTSIHIKEKDANYLEKAYLSLTIPNNVTIELNGALTVGALTGTSAYDPKTTHSDLQNGVSEFAKLILDGTINANSTNILAYGYIVGDGVINAKGSTKVTENFVIFGWVGGSKAAARYLGNQTISALEMAIPGTMDVKTPTMFPFSQYEMMSIQVNTIYHYGSTLIGNVKIGTSEQGGGLVKARVNQATACFISSSSDLSKGLWHLNDSNAKITKSVVNGRVKYLFDGNTGDGYTNLVLSVAAKTLELSTQAVFFPVDGNTDLIINSGTFTQNQKIKLMSGATLTVNTGANYSISSTGELIAYPSTFTEEYYPSGRGDALINVEGNITVNGAIAGKVLSITSGAKLILGSSAKTTITSVEGVGTRVDDGLKYTFTLAHNDIVRSLILNGSVVSTVNKTYTYNGTAWA